MRTLLLAGCLWLPCWSGLLAQLSTQSQDQEQALRELVLLETLVERRSGTRELLEFLERMLDARMLHVLGDGNLPFATWPISGWRWEIIASGGERIVLAIDGPYLVAIREGRSIKMSVRDLSAGGDRAPARLGLSVTRMGRVRHVDAMSLEFFSRTDRELFQIYYYFAGPTREIVNSRALPPSPLTEYLLKQ